MRTHAAWLLIVLLVAASLAAFPQTNARRTLNVVAFDSHDQIVSDLTSQDFQISDQGQPRSIVSFHRNGEPNAPQVAPPVVVLFDLVDDSLGNRGFGTQEIIKALAPLDSSDSLYLYLQTNGLKPVRGLPNPQEHNPPEKTPWTEHIKQLLEAAGDNPAGVRVRNTFRAANSVDAVSAIETLGEALKPFPGRKNLIWITSGVPLSYNCDSRERQISGCVVGTAIDNSPLINRIATTLDRDGVTVNSVHQGNNIENGDLATLDQFADLTGGKVYQNDIEKAVKEVMAASGAGYVIEYDAPRLDGKYHKIRLTCSRKGVRLQVKQGYYAN